MTIIQETDAGKRLDVWLSEQYPWLSRAHLQRLINKELVQVNGSAAKTGHKLRTNDQILLPNIEAISNQPVPVEPLPILYEDDDCLVMQKPIGLLTHARGGDSDPEPSVASFLRQYVSELSGERAGIVHRLDRATSGVIIGAKNPAALSYLQKQFSQRKVYKTYLAVVEGHLKDTEALIDMPIERNPKAPATFRVGPNGKSAQTYYKVVSTNDDYSLLELKPTTGRTHQLRVHLAHIGHPIVGDLQYDGAKADRLYLHAFSLEITVPSGERKTFTAATPAIFEQKVA